MTSGRGKVYTYDYSNKAATITKGGATISFEYDASEKCIKKTVSGSDGITTTRYISKLYECTEATGGSACVKHLFAGSQRFAMKDTTSTLYIHGDHLGSSNVITDSVLNGDGSVNILETITYFPYGKTRTDSGSGRGLNYKYTGQELDAETGLYNYGARLYDPVLARFTSPDWVTQSIRNPQFLNRYAYVLNNPIRYTDPSGNFIDGPGQGPALTCTLNCGIGPSPQPEPFFDFGSESDLVFGADLCSVCNEGGFGGFSDLDSRQAEMDMIALSNRSSGAGRRIRNPAPISRPGCSSVCVNQNPDASSTQRNALRVSGGSTPRANGGGP